MALTLSNRGSYALRIPLNQGKILKLPQAKYLREKKMHSDKVGPVSYYTKKDKPLALVELPTLKPNNKKIILN